MHRQTESRSLRYFVAVGRALSFTRAAEQLGIAQPPLSRQVKKLEQELGVCLFERSPRLRLTAAGQVLLERVEPALTMLDAACKSVAEEASASSATLSVGFVAAAAYEVLPRLASRLRREWPDIELRIQCMTDAEQAAAMACGSIDVGIAWLPFEHKGYEQIPLVRDRFLIALPTGHRLARQHLVSRDDLVGERLLLGCRNARIARAISRSFSGDDPDRGNLFETRVHDLRAAIDSVAAGLGITFVPSAMRGERSGHVIYRPFDSAEPLLLGAVCPGGAKPVALDRFLQCISAGIAHQGEV
jgi:DNA-binding transcriptional LysR family regulator